MRKKIQKINSKNKKESYVIFCFESNKPLQVPCTPQVLLVLVSFEHCRKRLVLLNDDDADDEFVVLLVADLFAVLKVLSLVLTKGMVDSSINHACCGGMIVSARKSERLYT